jgi:hypothetical protein
LLVVGATAFSLRLCHVSYSDRVPSSTVLLDLHFDTSEEVPRDTAEVFYSKLQIGLNDAES